jgi:hypothetical protein
MKLPVRVQARRAGRRLSLRVPSRPVSPSLQPQAGAGGDAQAYRSSEPLFNVNYEQCVANCQKQNNCNQLTGPRQQACYQSCAEQCR